MNRALVDPIADAVLNEGYILYPYRPSVKNRQRWTFGGLFPEGRSGDPTSNQTECLVLGNPGTSVEAVVRFLHLTLRHVEEGTAAPFRPVEALRVGDKVFHTWQEAEEREFAIEELTLGELATHPVSRPFAFTGARRSELLHAENGNVVGALVREHQAIAGAVSVSATALAERLFRVTVRVENRTPIEPTGPRTRDEALLSALISAHVLLGVRDGKFVSLMDPPDQFREAAAACQNVGLWPVLVGDQSCNDMMLSSPIILYDYPQVAPESPGDFFDGTEIDEMLTLRIMTMTDEEKREMAAVDEHAGALLARTEAMAREQLLGLHGTVRSLRPLP
jgi:hydrogenase maturation protease